MVDVRKGITVVKILLKYSSLTLLERKCYEGEVQPYRKTDYKPMMMMYICHFHVLYVAVGFGNLYLLFHTSDCIKSKWGVVFFQIYNT